MSIIISLVVLFIMKIRFFPGKSIANIITKRKDEDTTVVKKNAFHYGKQISYYFFFINYLKSVH